MSEKNYTMDVEEKKDSTRESNIRVTLTISKRFHSELKETADFYGTSVQGVLLKYIMDGKKSSDMIDNMMGGR